MGLICTPYGYSRAARVSGLSYQGVILGDKPVAYWPLNETSGTLANDLSGNGYNGTYEGAYTLSASGVELSGGQVNVPDIAQITPSLTSFTLECWYNTQSTADSSYPTLITIGASGAAANTGVFLYIMSTQVLAGGLAGQTTTTLGATAAVPTTDFWLANVVFTAGSAQLYLNGKATGTAVQYSPAITQNGANQLGQSLAEGSGNAPFLGSMKQVAVYPNALTAAQIQNHYNAGIA